MNQVKVQRLFPKGKTAEIEQLSARRDWMDETPEKHAYMCFPLNLTNRLGWGISFPIDLKFVWDGITDTTPDHIKILEGEEFLSVTRGNSTISFNTGLKFTTEENTSMLVMPVPNLFFRGAQCYTTLTSSSFYIHMIQVAWRLTEPNIEIHIPAGTPIAAVLPISLKNLEENYELCLIEDLPDQDYWETVKNYGNATIEASKNGNWSNFYRDGLDHTGNKVGFHETKSIKLKTISCPITGKTTKVEEEL